MAGDVTHESAADATLGLLQNWDDPDNPLASLEETQRDAVIDLSVYAGERPFPEEVCGGW